MSCKLRGFVVILIEFFVVSLKLFTGTYTYSFTPTITGFKTYIPLVMIQSHVKGVKPFAEIKTLGWYREISDGNKPNNISHDLGIKFRIIST